jgi:hypothetical protein
MRYMLLINSDKAAPPPASGDGRHHARHQRFAEELQAAKKMVHGERLRPDGEPPGPPRPGSARSRTAP